MKRFVIISALALAVAAAGIAPTQGFAADKPSCCKSERDCTVSLQPMSCCQQPVSTPAASNPVQLQTPSPAALKTRGLEVTLPQLACSTNSPPDQDDDQTDQSSLYLLQESWLI